MAALVESMFYYNVDENGKRFTPWHKLGKEVSKALSSAEAIKEAGLDWNVESKPIYDASGNEIPGYLANTRDLDNLVLGIVSQRYQVVQNSEAFEFTDSLLGDGMEYHTAGSLRDGKQIWLLAKMPDIKVLDDKFEPYICFTNTFDGSGAIRVCMTPVRVVCNNTLNLALKTAPRSWSARHTGSVAGKLEEARETLGLAEAYIKGLQDKALVLAEKFITDAELESIIDNIYPIDKEKDSNRKIENVNRIKESMFACYNMPDIKQYKGTAWGIINAATDYVDHVSPNRMTSNYQENNWGKIMGGHPFVDAIYELVAN